jgi:hypothetical protein
MAYFFYNPSGIFPSAMDQNLNSTPIYYPTYESFTNFSSIMVDSSYLNINNANYFSIPQFQS